MFEVLQIVDHDLVVQCISVGARETLHDVQVLAERHASSTRGGADRGKPTAAGPNSFNITATDSASNTANQTFSLTVNAGVSITSSATLPKGYQGTIYQGATLTATGGTGTGYNWSWAPANGSSIPAGLSLNNVTGVVSGTPTASGTFSVVVTVTFTLLVFVAPWLSLNVTVNV